MTDFSSLTARELGAAVTPLFIIDGRFQQEALNELVIRCEVADRLASTLTALPSPAPESTSNSLSREGTK